MKSDKDSPGGGAYTVEHQIGYLLRRAHQRATALFQANIGDPGTTPTQFTSMVKLGEQGELSQNLLGRLVGMDKATTQGVVRRLRDRALIAARPDPVDARRTLLRLTPAGEDVLARLVANGPRVSAETLKPLDAAEQRTLIGLLSRLT
jgi:DNA-binding MarR family transcriptional regulator